MSFHPGRFIRLTLASQFLLTIATAQELVPAWSILQPAERIPLVAIAPNNPWVATAPIEKPTINVWNLSDGSSAQTLPTGASTVIGLQFTPDGSLLALLSKDQGLQLWSTADWTKIQTISPASSLLTNGPIAFSPDGTLLVTSLNGTNNLGIWRVSDMQLLHSLPGQDSGVHAIDFAPDGSIFATGGGIRARDTTLKIWSSSTGQLLKTIPTSNTYGIDSLAFSPDGTMLATGTDHLSNFAGNIELWDTSTWTLLHQLPATGYRLAFTPDSHLLMSVNPARKIDIWDARAGTLLHSYDAPTTTFGMLWFADYSPDGETLILVGDTFKDEQWDTHITAVHAPVRTIEAHYTPGTLKINWTYPGTVLQIRTNWNTPWITLEEPGTTGTATLPTTRPAAFFRFAKQ